LILALTLLNAMVNGLDIKIRLIMGTANLALKKKMTKN
jgi:hypothetical protein